MLDNIMIFDDIPSVFPNPNPLIWIVCSDGKTTCIVDTDLLKARECKFAANADENNMIILHVGNLFNCINHIVDAIELGSYKVQIHKSALQTHLMVYATSKKYDISRGMSYSVDYFKDALYRGAKDFGAYDSEDILKAIVRRDCFRTVDLSNFPKALMDGRGLVRARLVGEYGREKGFATEREVLNKAPQFKKSLEKLHKQKKGSVELGGRQRRMH